MRVNLPYSHCSERQLKCSYNVACLNFRKYTNPGPDQVAPLVRASSEYAKFAGSIPSQGTYKNQPMNA